MHKETLLLLVCATIAIANCKQSHSDAKFKTLPENPLKSEPLTRNRRSSPSLPVDKRVFRNMLLGLVHKKNSEDIVQDSQTMETEASELLLELMVRIAAHPQQWNQVHELLKKIDTDIITSKKILSGLQEVEDTTPVNPTDAEQLTNTTQNTTENIPHKFVILLEENKEQSSPKAKNTSTNDWPSLDDENSRESDEIDNKQTKGNTYPWSTTSKQIPKPNLKDFEFAFHRVTGKPLPQSSSYDKTRSRNAYIAVSVIAPKSRLEKTDNLLEEELRQLKPWNHQENLDKMENIRKEWFVNTARPIED